MTLISKWSEAKLTSGAVKRFRRPGVVRELVPFGVLSWSAVTDRSACYELTSSGDVSRLVARVERL